ncbi:MAG: hypothetical protein P8189_24005, partial [Anaerolineae bacterium]
CQLRFRDYGHDRPIVRGEGGVWPVDGYGQHPDINAIYYHKALWAQIGGPFCLGEWYPRLFPDEFGLVGKFTAFEQFMAGERPYSYRDFEVQDGGIRAWGMVTDDRALVWIDNPLHTWKRVADQEPIPPVTGTVTFTDMEGTWLVQWWDTATGTVTGQAIVHADGVLELSIQNLEEDVALKLFRYKPGQRVYLPSVMKSRQFFGHRSVLFVR